MKKKLLFSALFAAALCAFSAFYCFAEAPSDDYRLLLSDEFDGSALDTKIWDWRTGDPYGGKNLKENVRLEDGKLVIDYKKIDGYYTGGGVLTNFNLPYGYYETRAKVFGGTGRFHTSFWLSGGSAFTTSPKNYPQKNLMIEIDGFEIDSENPTSISHGIIYWWTKRESASRWAYRNIDPSEEWFTMGMEWLPDRLNFYINGKLINTDDAVRVYGPSYLWLTAVAMPEGNEDKIDDSKLPGKSEFDYFRYYQKPLKNVNLLGNGNFEYDRGGNQKYPYCYILKGDTDAVFPIESPYAYDGNYCLEHYSANAYSASSGQEFCYLYPGKYTFSGMFRSTGGQSSARMVVYDKDGLVIAEKPIPQSETWQKIILSDLNITGYAYVAVESASDGKTAIYIDDLQFYAQDGEEYTAMNTPDYENYKTISYKGETILNLDNAADKSDGWVESSLSDSSYWSGGDDYAEWTFIAPASDDYKIQLYNLIHASNPVSQPYIITVNGTANTIDVDTQNGETGWITLLDSVVLSEGDIVTIRTGRGQSRGNIRTSDIRIVTNPVLDSSLMPAMLENSDLFSYGGRMYTFDKNDKTKTVHRENGTLYFPYEALKDAADVTVEIPQAGGQFVYDLKDAAEKSNNWKESSLMKGSFYAPADENTSAKWILAAPKNGTYYLDVYNLYDSANTAAQKYTVTAGGKSTEYIIDSRCGENRWESLGKYTLSAGDTITVLLKNAGTDGGCVRSTKLLLSTGDRYVSKEQVEIPQTGGQFVYDLKDAAEKSNNWKESSLMKGSFYAPADENTSAKWILAAPKNGTYYLDVYNLYDSANTAAQKYTVTAGGKSTEYIIDSRCGENRWESLGKYTLSAGDTITVLLKNAGTDGGCVRSTKLLLSTGDRYVSKEQIEEQSRYNVTETNGMIVLYPKNKEVTSKISGLLKQDLINFIDLFELKTAKNMGTSAATGQRVYSFDMAEKAGEWKLTNTVGSGSYYSYASGTESDTYVLWSITAPAAGKYSVQFYSPVHANSTNSARVTLLTNNGMSDYLINQKQDEGWYDLGVVDLNAGDTVLVRAARYKSSGVLRAKAVRLVPIDDSVTASRSGNTVTVKAGYGIHYYGGEIWYGVYSGDRLVKTAPLTPDVRMTFTVEGKNTYKVFFWQDMLSMRPLRGTIEGK